MEYRVTIHWGEESTVLPVQPGTLVSSFLGLAGHPIDLPCGGRGVCKNCRVAAAGALSPPTPQEAEALGTSLEAGFRLACTTRVLGEAAIRLPLTADGSFGTAVTAGPASTRRGERRYGEWGVAVDIGTTTLAAALCRNGAVVARAASKNPQSAYGADVISRVGLAMDGRGGQLAEAARQGVNGLLADLCAQAGILTSQLSGGVVTGNTAMLYLLTQRNPAALAAAPFAADWLAGETVSAARLGLTMAWTAAVYLPRCIGAFVGADILCSLLSSGMTESHQTALLADIGTNGELALWQNGRLVCCSTAAGPAFEGAGIVCGMHGVAGAIDHVTAAEGEITCTTIGGGEPRGLCGSGVVDAVAALRVVGAMDETGRITPEDCSCPHRISRRGGDLFFSLAGEVGLYGRDLRAVQLAKSAVCAGMETLPGLSGLGLSRVERLYIAGGFGSYLDLAAAAAIGLIPSALCPCAAAIGNAALSGAVMLLEDGALEGAAEALIQKARVVDLGTSPLFMERYLENMGFA